MSATPVLAATLVQPGKYELREYPLPQPAPGCALVKMELSGICGTDKHTYQGFTTQYAGTGDGKQIRFPIIQGHENVGTVAAIGGNGHYADFEGIPLQLGDRVVVGANVSCGECYYCRHDFPYYFCQNMTDYGNNLCAADPPYLFGGWSQYIYIVPRSFLVRVPDDLPSEVAVLTEVMAVTVGLDRAKQMSAFPSEAFLFDDTVVVLGVGPLGMCFLMKARMLGAGNIVAVDLSDYRLQFAKRLGADHVLNVSQTTLADRLEFVRHLTHGRGADLVIETAGVPQAVPEALEMLRLGGLLVEAGNVLTEVIAVLWSRSRQADVSLPQRGLPVRRYRCGSWGGTAWHVFLDEGSHARGGKHCCCRPLRLSLAVCQAARSRPCAQRFPDYPR